MQATVRRQSSLGIGPRRLDAAWKPVVVVLALSALIWGAVWVSDQPPTSVDGRSTAVWMSGEAAGRVVLAAPRSERASIAIDLAGGTAAADGTVSGVEYELADLGDVLLVHDRVSGAIMSVDARTGDERDKGPGPVPPDDRATVVDAGDRGYIVDPTDGTVQQVGPDGVRTAAVIVPDGFTHWVADRSGVLWLLDARSGRITTFDGTSLESRTSGGPLTSPVLSLVGDDPVLYDPTTNRVRWLRRDSSVEVPGQVAPADPEAVLVQQPDQGGSCLTVLAATTLSCIGPSGVVRSLALGQQVVVAGARLHASDRDVVITWAGQAAVTIVSWDGTASSAVRSQPSARPTVGTSSGGAIMVDDPGSPFAFTVDHGRMIELDKLSKRTIVVNQDATGAAGIGAVDENAPVGGILPSAPQTNDALDDGQNDPPVPRDDRITTRVGRSIEIPVLGNDADPEGDPLAVVAAGPLDAADGVVSVLRGSRVGYEPPAESDDRTIQFPYRVADLGGLEASATVVVEIVGSGRNSAPVPADDEVVTLQNSRIDIPVTSNDVDGEGDPLTVVRLSDPAHGTAAIGGEGTVRYEPTPGFVGDDTFTYHVVDGYGGEADGTVRVTVEAAGGPNRAPVAADDRASTAAGTRLFVEPLLNDSDPDGDPLRIVGVTPLAGVSVTLRGDRTVEVVPDASVAGLVAITYTIADPAGLQASARIALFVEAGGTKKPPVAIDDQATAASVAIPIVVTANDIDPNGGQLVVDQWTQPSDGAGSAVRTSPTTVQFTPAPGFIGTTRFDYTVKNVAGLTDTATVTVEVTEPSGSGPVARDDSVTAEVGDPVRINALANDTHPDREPLDFTGPPTTRSGTATIDDDRWIVFVPPNDDPGTFLVTYTIQDKEGRTSSANITISIVPRQIENRPPSAIDDLQGTTFGTPVVVPVLANDRDPDNDPIRITGVTAPTSGTADVVGSDRIRYTPLPGFTGVVSMRYTIADPDGLTATGTLTILVAAKATVGPTANADLVTLQTGSTSTTDPVSNDVDPDGSNLDLRLVSLGDAPDGISASASGRSVRITAGSSPGSYPLTYAIVDADGLSAIGTITVLVQSPPNSPPVAVGDSFTVLAQPVTVSVLDNDSDPDGGALTLVSVSALNPPTAGSVAVSNNQVLVTPTSSFSGTATFAYTVRDAQNSTAQASVTLSISACPAAPALSAPTVFAKFQTPVTVPLFGGAPAPAGTTVTLGTPGSGSATLSATRSDLVFIPATGFVGDVSIPFSVRTSCGDVSRSTVSITVNRPPQAVNDSASTQRGKPVQIDVLANDNDPDGDNLRVELVNDARGGVPTLTGQVVTFTPSATATNPASFSYRIVDPGGYSSIGRVTITLTNTAPVAVADATTIPSQSQVVSVDVTVNDTDANGDALFLTSAGPAAPTSAGTLRVRGNVIDFTPTSTARGRVVIPYVVSDGTDTAQGTWTITIANQNPIARPDTGTVAAGGSVVVDVLDNDSDNDGPASALQVVAVSNVSGGTVTIVAGGLRVTPSPGATQVTASYTIADADGGQATSTLTVSVQAPATTTTTPPTTVPPTTTPPTTPPTTTPPTTVPPETTAAPPP